MKKRVIAFLTVFVILLSLLAIPASAAETSTYLYNGVELPALPEWDRETYPYAYITQLTESGRIFVMFEGKTLTTSTSGNISNLFPSAMEYNCEYVNGKWENYTGSFLTQALLWSNTDVYDTDGNLYLAVSEPVPVYSGTVENITIGGCPDSCTTGMYVVAYATVSGTGEFDASYTMTLSGGTSSDTKLTSADGVNYTIDVGCDETAETLTLTAVSTADPSITDTHIITVKQAPTVTSVTVSPVSVDALPGDTVQFTASVTGTGDYNTGVWWTVNDNAVSGGVSVENGLVTIPDTYTGLIAVKATALGDSTVFDCAVITVQSSSGDGDTGDGDTGDGDTGGSDTDSSTSDDNSTGGNCASCQSILDYLLTVFEFRPFDFTTGALSDTVEQEVGIVNALYRFIQNMEQYVGTLVYSTSPNPIESEIKSDSYELAQSTMNDFEASADSGETANLSVSDTGALSKLVKKMKSWFSTNATVGDVVDIIDGGELFVFFSEEIASEIDTVPVSYSLRDDPCDTSAYDEKFALLSAIYGSDE